MPEKYCPFEKAPLKEQPKEIVKNIVFVVKDSNGKTFRSKSAPEIWVDSLGRLVLEVSDWDQNYLEGDPEDFRLFGCGFENEENDDN